MAGKSACASRRLTEFLNAHSELFQHFDPRHQLGRRRRDVPAGAARDSRPVPRGAHHDPGEILGRRSLRARIVHESDPDVRFETVVERRTRTAPPSFRLCDSSAKRLRSRLGSLPGRDSEPHWLQSRWPWIVADARSESSETGRDPAAPALLLSGVAAPRRTHRANCPRAISASRRRVRAAIQSGESSASAPAPLTEPPNVGSRSDSPKPQPNSPPCAAPLWRYSDRAPSTSCANKSPKCCPVATSPTMPAAPRSSNSSNLHPAVSCS